MAKRPRVSEIARAIGMDPKLAVEVLNGEFKEFVKTPSSTMEPPAVRKLKQWAKAHGYSTLDVRAVGGQDDGTATPPVASAPAPLAYVNGDGLSVNELARAYGLEPAWMLDLVLRAGLQVAGVESRIPSDGTERLQRTLAALGYLPHLDTEPHPNGAKPWRAIPPLPVPGPPTIKQSTPKAAPLPKSVTPVVRQAEPVPLAPSLDRAADRAPLTVAKFFYRDVWSSSDLLTVRERMVAWLERHGDTGRAQWWKTTELTWCDEYFGQELLRPAHHLSDARTTVQRGDLIFPSAVFAFGKRVDLPRLHPLVGRKNTIRAISWEALPEGLLAKTWGDQNANGGNTHIKELSSTLIPFGQQLWNTELAVATLIRAIGSICRSPLSSMEFGTGSGDGTSHRSDGNRKSSDIRRIYIRRTERPGAQRHGVGFTVEDRTPAREHWVRGHQRNQWYPSIEEHRPVWIERHRSGSGAPIRDQRTVNIARGDRPSTTKE